MSNEIKDEGVAMILGTFGSGKEEDIIEKDELSIAFELFNKAITPQLTAMLDMVEKKGKEFDKSYLVVTTATGGWQLSFIKQKIPVVYTLENVKVSQIAEVEISNRRFFQVGFVFQDKGPIIVRDNAGEMSPVVLDTPEALLKSVSGTGHSPASNISGVLGMFVADLDKIQKMLTEMPNLR